LSKNARRNTRRNKPRSEQTFTRKNVPELLAQTPRQRDYINALMQDDLIFCIGYAGTGKTYVSATAAAKFYQERRIQKIVITRPNIASGKGIGFFPGTLLEKMSPWVAPIVDVLIKHLGKPSVDIMLKHGDLVIEPFETLRGKSFENSFVMLDEAQNCTYEQLKMFLTRLGDGSKTVINGDVMQTDLSYNSGLRQILSIAKDQMLPFPIIEFQEEDIVRSDICATWIKAFGRNERIK
jgi:phosphate starvation-inducible PhoH-like protein